MSNYNIIREKAIIKEIENARKKMHYIARKKGLRDREVLKISKSIDEKLNKLQLLRESTPLSHAQ